MGVLQPDYDDLYDLPGNGETAADLDDPDRQVGRIATGENLQRAFTTSMIISTGIRD